MNYDHDLCILFLYHKCDALTKKHLNCLRASNPGAHIIPLTDSVPELLPDSVDVGLFPSSFASAHKWRNIDATLYRWFEHRVCIARRYLIVEYDCLCNVNLDEYYAEVRDADVAGIDFFTQEDNPRWKWFGESELRNLPMEDRKYAAGISPLTCTMFSNEALESIVNNIYRNDVFCELRLGTIIRKLGLKFQRLPVLKRSTICWHIYPWRADRAGLFHGIKSLDHNNGRAGQPGNLDSRIYDWLRSFTSDRELLPFHLRGRWQGFRRRMRLRGIGSQDQDRKM
jgi:hypothetical protein